MLALCLGVGPVRFSLILLAFLHFLFFCEASEQPETKVPNYSLLLFLPKFPNSARSGRTDESTVMTFVLTLASYRDVLWYLLASGPERSRTVKTNLLRIIFLDAYCSSNSRGDV